MIPAQCQTCKNLTGKQVCRAFPHGIPHKILLGEHDHRKPYKGDNGIRYEPIDKQERTP